MDRSSISPQTRALLLKYQKGEETDHLIYRHMAGRETGDNQRILTRIASNEKEHAGVWARYTGEKVGPDRLKAYWYMLMTYIFGFTFVYKIMERGEYAAGSKYQALIAEIPQAKKIIEDEERHEHELSTMLNEDRLKYVGAMVLGLNDALVELSGTIAGLTLALAHTRVVAMAGIITGVAATLSMAASNYLAEKADGNEDALKSSLYTGVAYLVTVVLLVLPYLLYPEDMYLAALGTMLGIVVLIIFVFNYYVSVAKDLPFFRRFAEMAGISLGVAVISFGIGVLAKELLGVDL